jgi:hypothetical protein
MRTCIFINILPILVSCDIENNLNYIGPFEFGADCQPSVEPLINDEPPIAICDVSNILIEPIHEMVDFYGDESYDPNNYEIKEYNWTLIKRPDGSGNSLQDYSQNVKNIYGFAADLAGDYTVELKVMNDRCLVSEPCLVTVTALPKENLWIEMYWSRSGDDMDLHLLQNNGSIESENDCYYGNCIVDDYSGLNWGNQNQTLDDPHLDLDDIDNIGPENINIEQPANGIYTVMVHDYPGSVYEGANEVTVRIYQNREIVYDVTKEIVGEDSYTKFAEIIWPEGIINQFE